MYIMANSLKTLYLKTSAKIRLFRQQLYAWKTDVIILISERAHYMCPNMHFGIMAETGAEFDADLFNRKMLIISIHTGLLNP